MATEEELAKINEKFREACICGQVLFKIKNRQYDNTIELTGMLGAAVELIGATARLRPLILKSNEDQAFLPENINAIHDVALDIHNYASILIIMLKEKNWSGK